MVLFWCEAVSSGGDAEKDECQDNAMHFVLELQFGWWILAGK